MIRALARLVPGLIVAAGLAAGPAPAAEGEPYVSVLAFAAGRPLDTAERSEVQRLAEAERKADPAAGRPSSELRARIAALEGLDAVRRVRAGETMRGAIHCHPRGDAADEAAVRIVFRDDPVVATDCAAGLVVTRSAVAALFEAGRLVARETGEAGPTAEDEQSYLQSAAARFAGYRPEQKRRLAFAASRLALLRSEWRPRLVQDLRPAVRAHGLGTATQSLIDRLEGDRDMLRAAQEIDRKVKAAFGAMLQGFPKGVAAGAMTGAAGGFQ